MGPLWGSHSPDTPVPSRVQPVTSVRRISTCKSPNPVADMLTRIRNANSAKHDTVDVPASNLKKAIAQILLDEGYIKAFQVTDEGVQGNIHITLKYVGKKEKVISGLRRVSKPGLRVYAGAEELPRSSRAWHAIIPRPRRHDRQEGQRASRRRRGPGLCMVRR